jgi:hypothetical protein
MAEVNFLVKKGLTVPKNSASTPAIIFDAADPNTGIYSPGADQVAISTNGTGRLFVDASGNVGIGTNSPSASALLDVSSTTQGLLPPRMTGVQRDAISSPAAGLMIYNTTTNKLNFYNGTAWEAVTSA